MTVPGKGGRPRKWRSDADRVRAYRARQRGNDEPATLESALAAGDEEALAWESVRELGETITQQRNELRSLRAALRSSEKALEQERRRFGWITGENDRLRTELAHVRRDRDLCLDQLDESGRNATPASAATPPAVQPSLNRAQRRRAERAQRGKSDGSV